MALVLSEIDITYLDIFEQASYYDLKRQIDKLFKNKMAELYEGKLHFEQTLSFDVHCKEIERSINYLIKSNIKIYKHLEQN